MSMQAVPLRSGSQVTLHFGNTDRVSVMIFIHVFKQKSNIDSVFSHICDSCLFRIAFGYVFYFFLEISVVHFIYAPINIYFSLLLNKKAFSNFGVILFKCLYTVTLSSYSLRMQDNS